MMYAQSLLVDCDTLVLEPGDHSAYMFMVINGSTVFFLLYYMQSILIQKEHATGRWNQGLYI